MTSSTPIRVDRKVTRRGESDTPRIERVGNTWHIRAVDLARQVLREKDGSHQAGFLVEASAKAMQTLRPPILWMDGADHREQRAKTARFFAPKTVDTRYRELMETRSQALVDEAVAAGGVTVDDLSLRYSVEIAARVIGLTDSSIEGMAKRLIRLFKVDNIHPGTQSSRFDAIRQSLTTLPAVAAFYAKDVRPAIRVRRAEPREDVISHLLGEGYSPQEILTECVTYAAAGMVTTREFITMCVWHLMERPEVRARYLVVGDKERYAILDEILRLEPIVGHLYRRVQRDFIITDGDASYELREGDLVDFYVRQANADETVVGEEPLALCPGRELPRGVGGEVLSFGDGPHKCPGNALAIQETDILLTKLLALDVELVAEPEIGWDEVIAGYALRGLRLRLGR